MTASLVSMVQLKIEQRSSSPGFLIHGKFNPSRYYMYSSPTELACVLAIQARKRPCLCRYAKIIGYVICFKEKVL